MNEREAIDRVRKLLALSQSDNEHESALALGRAQALMDKFRIEAATLDESNEPEEDIEAWDDPLVETSAKWARALGMVIADANGCSVYGDRKRLVICGRASKVATARYVFAYCKREIERLASRKGGNGRTWLNQYRHGCVDAIRSAIRTERDKERAQTLASNTDQRALVVIKNAMAKVDQESGEVDQWATRKFRLHSGGSSRVGSNPGARAAGRNDGSGIYGSSGSARPIGAGNRQIGG